MGHNNIDNRGQIKNGMVSSRTVAVYTVLLVLMTMRERLGIEAMVGFLERYTATIERLNPEIRQAVNHELLERALHGLYEAVCRHEE